MKLIIKNVFILDPENNISSNGTIYIENGVFSAPFEPDSDTRIIDGSGLTAAPGLVDLHVHLRDPGQTQKEDILSGCRAAAAGGVTSLLAMPNTVPAVDSPEMRLSSPGAWTFVSKLNDKQYAVESPDAIRASDSRGFTWMRYGENGLPAAIASNRGSYRTVVMGFPLEAVTTTQERTSLMSRIMDYLK